MPGADRPNAALTASRHRQPTHSLHWCSLPTVLPELRILDLSTQYSTDGTWYKPLASRDVEQLHSLAQSLASLGLNDLIGATFSRLIGLCVGSA